MQPNQPTDAVVERYWQTLAQQATRTPHLAALLLARSRQLLERFTQIYQTLCKLPRPRRRRWQRLLGGSLATVALTLALSNTPIAYAASITVTTNVPDINDDGQCALIEAIINANDDAATHDDCTAGSGPDTITLAGNTYTLTASYAEVPDVGDVGLPFITSTITIEGNDATILRDGGADPFGILYVDSSGDLTLNHTTISGGYALVGAGIYSYGGIVTLNNSTISDNTAAFYGGGLLNVDGVMTVNTSTVSGNTVLARAGGGIANVTSTPPDRSGRFAKRQHFTSRQGRALNVTPAELTLVDTEVSTNYAIYAGGIFNLGAVASLNSSTVSTNTAACCGGGLLTYEGTLTLDNSTVVSNTAGDDGGGIESGYSDLILQNNSRVHQNSAGGDGGGIDSYDSTVTLTDSTVSNNQAGDDGGGIDALDSTVSLTNSSISGNSAVEDGGGMDPDYSTVTMENSTVNDNTAGYSGGAIFLIDGSVTLTNSTVSGNSAGDDAGGIGVEDGTVTLVNSTLTANEASEHGGALFNGDNASMELVRTLSSGNSATNGGNEIYNVSGSTVTADAQNLFGDSSQSTAQAFVNFTPGASDIVATSNGTLPTALNAILDTTLATNGASGANPPLTNALVSGSPALNAATAGPTTDQRGVARPQGPAFDIGAVEVKAITSSVTQTGVTTANNPTPQNCPATGTNLAIYTITPTFQNSSGNTFTDLFFQVKQLEYTTPNGQQPSLCNATTVVNNGGVGSLLAVPNSALPGGDNAFNPSDSLSQAFQIGRPVAAQFRIKVDLFSTTATGAQASGAAESVQYLGSFVYEVDENGQIVNVGPTIFLPLIAR